MRDVRARRQSPPGLYPCPHRHRLVDVEHVCPTVVGMTAWCDIPAPEVLAVEHTDDRSAPPRSAGDDVGDRAQLDAVSHDTEHIERDALHRRPVATVAERAMQISRRHGERRARPAGDELRRARRRSRRRRVLGAGRPARPSPHPFEWSRHDRHRQTTDDGDAESATTSRNAASAACRAARRVSGSGATIAIWFSRSISCFIVLTKSPPVSSSSATTCANVSPAIHA